MTAALNADKLWKFFGDYPAIRDLSLAVEPGSCLALLGRNGAGKTTFLRMAAGLSRAARGSITVLGDDVRSDTARARIGVLGHGIGVYDELSAIENLRLFAKLYEVRDADAKCRQWLERVGLERVERGLVREFSRGMRQRLAIARACLHNPSVLLARRAFYLA